MSITKKVVTVYKSFPKSGIWTTKAFGGKAFPMRGLQLRVNDQVQVTLEGKRFVKFDKVS